MVSNQESRLTIKDHTLNAFQASLLAIPVFGASLEKLLFGSLSDLRMRRVEDTLREVGIALQEMRAEVCIGGNEDFANLLEVVAPKLGRSISEEKRIAFRNLLLNATQLLPGDVKWTEAELATRLLESVNEVGMSLITSIHSIRSNTRRLHCSIFLMQDEQFVVADHHAEFFRTSFDFDRDDHPIARLQFHDAVARFWIEELYRQNLLTYSSCDVLEYRDVRMTSSAGLLIEWTLGQGERLWL